MREWTWQHFLGSRSYGTKHRLQSPNRSFE
jgi:hypothetical protein